MLNLHPEKFAQNIFYNSQFFDFFAINLRCWQKNSTLIHCQRWNSCSRKPLFVHTWISGARKRLEAKNFPNDPRQKERLHTKDFFSQKSITVKDHFLSKKVGYLLVTFIKRAISKLSGVSTCIAGIFTRTVLEKHGYTNINQTSWAAFSDLVSDKSLIVIKTVVACFKYRGSTL